MKRQYFYTSFDGKQIHVTEWAVDHPIGLVQIAHGMVEHAGRYEAFANHLNAQGYLVFADDHRGHGNTDPESLGYADGDMFTDTLKDMASLSKAYKEKYPHLPLCLMGHSYGSFLAQAYLPRYGRFLSSAILMGSAKLSKVESLAGAAVARMGKAKNPCNFVKKITFDAYNKKFDSGNFVSSKEEEAKRYREDPFCGYVCSNAFYASFLSAASKLYQKQNAEKIKKTLPVLIISGANDPVGKMGKTTTALFNWYSKMGMRDVTLKLIDGARHECLNDVGKEETYATIDAFLARTNRQSE